MPLLQKQRSHFQNCTISNLHGILNLCIVIVKVKIHQGQVYVQDVQELCLLSDLRFFFVVLVAVMIKTL
jgi:hypothetical protein